MKRAFLAIAWGMDPDTTKITGPYDTDEGAADHLQDEDGLGEGNERGAVIGPFPIRYLDEELERAPLTTAFAKTLTENFRPSELLALYEECQREAADDADRAKMVYIREAYTALTGTEL